MANGELRGFLSSGRRRSVQKLCLALEPGGGERKKVEVGREGSPQLLDGSALGQLLERLTLP